MLSCRHQKAETRNLWPIQKPWKLFPLSAQDSTRRWSLINALQVTIKNNQWPFWVSDRCKCPTRGPTSRPLFRLPTSGPLIFGEETSNHFSDWQLVGNFSDFQPVGLFSNVPTSRPLNGESLHHDLLLLLHCCYDFGVMCGPCVIDHGGSSWNRDHNVFWTFYWVFCISGVLYWILLSQ